MPEVIEPISGRRGVDTHGCRFHLDPTPREFSGFFAGLHGAAFIAMGGHVAFGAGTNGSIDHPSIARAFSLDGEEVFRGYVQSDRQAVLEIWVDAWDEASMTDEQRAKVAAIIAAYLSDRCLSRLALATELVVYSTEHGQPIVERPLERAVAEAAA